MRYPIRGLGRLSAATLPKGCAGWNCHQLAPRVSDPADIHGGNAVAEGRHSEVHDELSVRTQGDHPAVVEDAVEPIQPAGRPPG